MRWIDRWIIDGFVRFASGAVAALSSPARAHSNRISSDLCILVRRRTGCCARLLFDPLIKLMIPHLLSLVLFLPVCGMLVLLAIPNERPKAAARLGESRCTGDVRRVFAAVPGVQPERQRFSVCRAGAMDTVHRRAISGWPRWNFAADGVADDADSASSRRSVRGDPITERTRLYYAMLLLLETGVLGVFLSLDLFLFYIFWDSCSSRCIFLSASMAESGAAMRPSNSFLYTLLGSVFMLLGFLALYFQYGARLWRLYVRTQKLLSLNLAPHAEQWIFFALFLGFAVKIPMFPLHTWLPDAHTEAPTAGSVLLASSVAENGYLRILALLAPAASESFNQPWIVNTDGHAFPYRHHLWRACLPHPARLEAAWWHIPRLAISASARSAFSL